MRLCLLVVSVTLARAQVPTFEQFPVEEMFQGVPARPSLVSPQHQSFRSRIRNGVKTGSDVWYRDGDAFVPTKGPNFAGHYLSIIWGCGSQCVMMATVDAITGIIYAPPLRASGELSVPLDNHGKMRIEFKPNSSLMILRNACANFKNRASCGTYYFNWQNHRYEQLVFVPVKE